MLKTRDEYQSLYLSYLQRCNQHDFAGMVSFYAPTIKVNDGPMDPTAVAEQFAPITSAFPDWHWEIRNLVIDGDSVAVHFSVTGTHKGAFQGVEATDRRVNITQFTFYRFEEGKILEVWDHADMDELMRQITAV
ncbi:ester cyclase [Streptomyces sp. NPDC002755]